MNPADFIIALQSALLCGVAVLCGIWICQGPRNGRKL